MSIVVPTSAIDTETNAIEYTGGTNLFKRGNLVQYSAANLKESAVESVFNSRFF